MTVPGARARNAATQGVGGGATDPSPRLAGAVHRTHCGVEYVRAASTPRRGREHSTSRSRVRPASQRCPPLSVHYRSGAELRLRVVVQGRDVAPVEAVRPLARVTRRAEDFHQCRLAAGRRPHHRHAVSGSPSARCRWKCTGAHPRRERGARDGHPLHLHVPGGGRGRRGRASRAGSIASGRRGAHACPRARRWTTTRRRCATSAARSPKRAMARTSQASPGRRHAAHADEESASRDPRPRAGGDRRHRAHAECPRARRLAGQLERRVRRRRVHGARARCIGPRSERPPRVEHRREPHRLELELFDRDVDVPRRSWLRPVFVAVDIAVPGDKTASGKWLHASGGVHGETITG